MNQFSEYRNPNGDTTPLSKHSIDLESLRHFGHNLNKENNEFLPEPSLLSSSSSTTKDTTLTSSQAQASGHLASTSGTRKIQNNAIVLIPENSGHFVATHHALSSAKKRHRRSFTVNRSSFKRRIISKRFIMKRNFPTHHLSIETDSNETEFEAIDVEETGDDYMHRRVGNTVKTPKHSAGHDLLDFVEDVSKNDEGKTSNLFAPYWDAYDTVNQLYLEISKYRLINSVYLRVIYYFAIHVF